LSLIWWINSRSTLRHSLPPVSIRQPQRWRWGGRLGRGAGLGLGGRLHRGSKEDVIETGQGWGGEGLIGGKEAKGSWRSRAPVRSVMTWLRISVVVDVGMGT